MYVMCGMQVFRPTPHPCLPCFVVIVLALTWQMKNQIQVRGKGNQPKLGVTLDKED